MAARREPRRSSVAAGTNAGRSVASASTRMAPPSPAVTDACTAVPAIETRPRREDRPGRRRRSRSGPAQGPDRSTAISPASIARRSEQRRQRGCVGHRERQAHIVEPLVVEEDAAGGGEPDTLGGRPRRHRSPAPRPRAGAAQGQSRSRLRRAPGRPREAAPPTRRRRRPSAASLPPSSRRRRRLRSRISSPTLPSSRPRQCDTGPSPAKHQPHRRAAVETEAPRR